MLPHALSLYTQISIASLITNGRSTPSRASRESSSSLTSSPSDSPSSSVPPQLLNSLSGVFRLHPLSVSYLYHTVSALYIRLRIRATDRVTSVVAGSDDSGSIAPTPDSPWTGLRSKWTGGALRATQAAERRADHPTVRPGSRAMPARPRVPRCSHTPTLACHGTAPAARHPAAAAASPAPRRDSGSSPVCSGQGRWAVLPAVVGCARRRRRATAGSPAPGLGTPAYGHFPRTPLSGFAALPTPKDTAKKDD
jgi:hypothetical protein